MWTQFMDMHSGGGQKLDWAYIYIEAPIDEAAVIFQNLFDRNPYRVTCTCCGDDYSLSESKTLEQATAYNRHCNYVKGGYVEGQQPDDKYGPAPKYVPFEEYIARKGIKIVRASEITPAQRKGELSREGYHWN